MNSIPFNVLFFFREKKREAGGSGNSQRSGRGKLPKENQLGEKELAVFVKLARSGERERMNKRKWLLGVAEEWEEIKKESGSVFGFTLLFGKGCELV